MAADWEAAGSEAAASAKEAVPGSEKGEGAARVEEAAAEKGGGSGWVGG